jgi:hypothetical protein
MWYAPKLPILIGKMMENDFLHQFRDTLFSDKTQTEKKNENIRWVEEIWHHQKDV